MNTSCTAGLALALGCLPMAVTATDYGQGLPARATPHVLNNSQGENAHWTGIGRLQLPDQRQCIASLLDTRSEPGQATGPAYVVTAGHCASKRNGAIVQDAPLEASLVFNFFADTEGERPTVAVRRIVWSSMQGSDLALLELDARLEQLLAQGIQPLTLGPAAADGSAVLMVGETTASDRGLRLSTCTQQSLPWLMEAPWIWRNLTQNDCTGAGEGASGSPVLERGSNALLSVVNSLLDEGVAAVPVQRLQGCFAAGHVIPDLPSCTLLPGFQLTQTEVDTFKALDRLQVNDQGQITAPTWNFNFTIDTPRYRFKSVDDPLACEAPAGYSGSIDSEIGLIQAPLEAQAGWQFLCVVGVDSAEQLSWPGLMANALSVPMQLLPAGPVAAPKVQVDYKPNGDAVVNWVTDPPHIVRYRAKRGAPETTDCADPRGYGPVPHERFVFKANRLPLTLCTIAIDGLRESSAPRTDVIARADN